MPVLYHERQVRPPRLRWHTRASSRHHAARVVGKAPRCAALAVSLSLRKTGSLHLSPSRGRVPAPRAQPRCPRSTIATGSTLRGRRRRASAQRQCPAPAYPCQVAALCGQHCLNNLLQGPYFSEISLAEIAQVTRVDRPSPSRAQRRRRRAITHIYTHSVARALHWPPFHRHREPNGAGAAPSHTSTHTQSHAPSTGLPFILLAAFKCLKLAGSTRPILCKHIARDG